jgi:Holliday junction DNA helicase RuvA
MITRIAGQLEQVGNSSATVSLGGLWYEVMIAACDVGKLSGRLGGEIVLYTIHIIEGDPSRGQVMPRLIGFLAEADREFFRAFTKVKGIGPKKALRALVRPIAEIAAAIENKDAKTLVALPEIGKRTAELIIAQLHGKMGHFAGDYHADETATGASPSLSEPGLEAVVILTQLGERRPDALALVERVLACDSELDSPSEIVQLVYKLKAGGV